AFEWVVTSGACPPTRDTVIIISALAPTVDAGDDAEFCGLGLQLDGNSNAANILWEFPAGIDLADPFDLQTMARADSEGVFVLALVAFEGNCTVRDSVKLSFVAPSGPANAGPDQTLPDGAETSLAADANYVGTGIWTVIQGNAMLMDPTDPQTEVTGLDTDTTVLLWTVTNGICPAVSDMVSIFMDNVLIPSGFSPNDDGKNDTFKLGGFAGFADVTVFNRWGNVVFSGKNYRNDWPGTNAEGKPLTDDTYFYVVELPDGRAYEGFVVIKR
ncbi:MAG: gliding motility-associated C-terminal domain-containing protein, partial [Bacteroidota bacterium]